MGPMGFCYPNFLQGFPNGGKMVLKTPGGFPGYSTGLGPEDDAQYYQE